MTFTPARTAEPPAAGQPPTDTPDAVLDQVEEAVDSGRAQIADARSAALRAAETDAERDAINARFDQVEQSFGNAIARVEQAITSGNAQLLAGLQELVGAKAGEAGAGEGDNADDDDGDIIGIELLDDALDAASEGVGTAVEAAGAAVEAAGDVAADVMPKRDHPLFRKLFGGS